DHGAGRRRRARGAAADRDAERQARRRGRDGHAPGRGRAGTRRPRAAARPRPRRRARRDRGRGARPARVRAGLRPFRRPRRGDAVTDLAGPSWHELWSNLAIFKDAIWVGGLAGALLGAIGGPVVLRGMVFASSAIAQAAALGVALSFWIPALIDPSGHAAGHAAG